MFWLIGILLLSAVAWFLLIWKPRQAQPEEATQPESLPQSLEAFQTVLAQAIAKYEKEELAYALRRMVILEGHPDSLLATFEVKYGPGEGVPFLDLPGPWNPRTREVVRAWMAQNGVPFSEDAPTVQQLEQALEARVAEQAREILDRSSRGDGRAISV